MMSLFKGIFSLALILKFLLLLLVSWDIMAEKIEPNLIFVVC